jgi:NDP-4-keto-2,6-dideoxyhexose 3-C-methyltransferase
VNCRSCQTVDLTEVLDLGNQYLSDFRDDDRRPPQWPLTLMSCQACGLLQLQDTAPRELMYHDRYGFRSGVNEAICADLRSIVKHVLTARPDTRRWLDIACNDGTLLSFVSQEIHRVGINPVTTFESESRQYADRIIVDFFDPRWFTSGQDGQDHERFDVITCSSMFYDLDDPNEFVADVAQVLAPDGVWVIQQSYVLTMLELGAVDNVCHERITYWSLAALEHLLDRHGLEINDVLLSGVNGGSFRTMVSHRGARAGQHPGGDQDRQRAARRTRHHRQHP